MINIPFLGKRKSILFVCTGNTCRSPMAEYVFKHYLKEKKALSRYKVFSAGINVSELDKDISYLAKQALKSLEIKFNKHSPQQLDIKTANNSDFVVCMTPEHKDAITKVLGKDERIKTFAEIAELEDDIHDPYGRDLEEYVSTCKQLLAGSEKLYEFVEGKSVDTVKIDNV